MLKNLCGRPARMLLVYPDYTDRDSTKRVSGGNYSEGLASISAVLKQGGHDVRLLHLLNLHTEEDFKRRLREAGEFGAAHLKAQKSAQNAFKFGTEKNRGSRITAAKLRLPAKGGLTQFGGAAGPQARAAPLLYLSSHRWVPWFPLAAITKRRERHRCFHTPDCSMRLAMRCRSFALSTASICR